MGLVDEYAAIDAEATSSRRCAFTDIREGNHPTVTWDELVEFMSDRSRKHTTIAQVLRDRHGIMVAEFTVGRHRRGGFPGVCTACRAAIGGAA